MGAGAIIEPESTMKKMCKALCALILIALSLVLALGYMGLASRADFFNASVNEWYGGETATPYYDDCSVPAGYTLKEFSSGLGSMSSIVDDLTNDITDYTQEAFDKIDESLEDLEETVNDAVDENGQEPDENAADIADENNDSVDLTPDVDEEDLNELAENFNDSLGDLTDLINNIGGTDWIIAAEGTGWTMMYNFNAVFFIILLVQSLLLLISAFVMKLRGILMCCCCCCTNNIHLIMLIMALAYRYDDAGTACSLRDVAYSTSGHTFMADAETFGTLSILGIATWIIFCCGPCCIARVDARKQ